MSLKDIYKNAGVVMKPAAMKEGKLYSQQPHSGAGDFNFSRADGVQTRINKHGLIETVADNVPRLSYDLVDGKVSDCPHLLLEPSRYNNLQRSEEFENGYWNKSLISVKNNHVSPDGSASADKVIATSSTGAHFFRRTGLNYSASKHTFSIFAKFTDDLYEQFHFVIYDGSNHFAYFDVKNGNLGSADSGVETSITKYPNGWYRCTATYQTNSFSGGQIKVELGSSVTTTGDNSSGMLFWGIMWETGSYPTSYIPTSGSTETRQVDDIQLDYNIESSDGFSAVVGFDESNAGTGTSVPSVQFNDDTSNTYMGFGSDSTRFRCRLNLNGTSYLNTQTNAFRTQKNKLFISCDSNGWSQGANGVTNSTGSNDASVFNKFTSISYSAREDIGVIMISEMSLFTTRLSNSELELLTTP